MSKNYIVKIDDETQLLVEIGVNSTGAAVITTKHPKYLTPYTEPDTEKVRKEVCDKCMNETEDLAYQLYSVKVDEAYQRGLNAAWEAAKKIVLSKEAGGLFDYDARKAVFGCGNYMALKKYTVSEVIEKIRQYEQEKEEIKVGDEIEWNGENYVVTYIHCDNEYVDALDCSSGSVCDNLSIKAFKKTGRHFPEIAEVLRKMQEEKE